jgi:hemerythrin superfamily protein
MADTKVRVRKATALLKEDHQKVKKLFSQFEKLDAGRDSDRAQLFDQIKKELTVHAQIEEEIFYPAVERAEDEEADDLVREAHEEHRIVKTLLEELSALSSADPQFDAKIKVLKENVLHHAEEEQDEIFPVFDSLERMERERISEQLQARKRELTGEA